MRLWKSCGFENPDPYRYSGKCGEALGTAPLKNEAAFAHPTQPITVSGPSILGLDAESQEDNASYLLDDEPPSSHGGRWFLFLLIVLCGAGAYYAYQKY